MTPEVKYEPTCLPAGKPEASLVRSGQRAQSSLGGVGRKSPFQRRKQKVRICFYLFLLLFHVSGRIRVVKAVPPPFWGKVEHLRRRWARHAGQGPGCRGQCRPRPVFLSAFTYHSAFHGASRAPSPASWPPTGRQAPATLARVPWSNLHLCKDGRVCDFIVSLSGVISRALEDAAFF